LKDHCKHFQDHWKRVQEWSLITLPEMRHQATESLVDWGMQ